MAVVRGGREKGGGREKESRGEGRIKGRRENLGGLLLCLKSLKFSCC